MTRTQTTTTRMQTTYEAVVSGGGTDGGRIHGSAARRLLTARYLEQRAPIGDRLRGREWWCCCFTTEKKSTEKRGERPASCRAAVRTTPAMRAGRGWRTGAAEEFEWLHKLLV